VDFGVPLVDKTVLSTIIARMFFHDRVVVRPQRWALPLRRLRSFTELFRPNAGQVAKHAAEILLVVKTNVLSD
jgi:hypothetical protein